MCIAQLASFDQAHPGALANLTTIMDKLVLHAITQQLRKVVLQLEVKAYGRTTTSFFCYAGGDGGEGPEEL